MKIGLRLRGGAQSPVSLAHVALDAERAGLEFVQIADDARLPTAGAEHAASAWPAVGAIAMATRFVSMQIDGIPVTGTMHPAAVARLALSSAALLPGRFTVGFSAGSRRAVTGAVSPARRVRLRALIEAVTVFRRLARGERVDERDSGLVINDLRLPGGTSQPPEVAITATEETEAVVAAGLGCHLVVPLGADVAEVVGAYERAGGTGEISAAILLAEALDPASLDVAREMLLDRAALEERLAEGPDADELAPPTDEAVRSSWVDPADPDQMTAAIRRHADIGVARIELSSPARDPHLAIRQWRAYRELIEIPVVSRTTIDDVPASDRTDAKPVEPAAAEEPAVPERPPALAGPVEPAAAEEDAVAERPPVPVPAEHEPEAEPEAEPAAPAAEAQPAADPVPSDEPESVAASASDPEAEEWRRQNENLRSALELALADDEAHVETELELSDPLRS